VGPFVTLLLLVRLRCSGCSVHIPKGRLWRATCKLAAQQRSAPFAAHPDDSKGSRRGTDVAHGYRSRRARSRASRLGCQRPRVGRRVSRRSGWILGGFAQLSRGMQRSALCLSRDIAYRIGCANARKERAPTGHPEALTNADGFVDESASPASLIDAARRRFALRELLDELPLAQRKSWHCT